MNLIRHNRGQFPGTFSHMLDNIFNEAVTTNKTSGFSPKTDIKETESHYELSLAVPGLSKDDIDIALDKNVLTISGERKVETKKEDENYHLVETQFGSFSRTFSIPESVNAEKIDAKYENGLLNIVLPKERTQKLSKNIKIK